MSLEKISVKIHDGGVVSLCDEGLIGKHFEDENHSLRLSEHFFKGEHFSKKELVEILEGARSLNVVGPHSVHFVVEEGFISAEEVLSIQGVPHVQIYTL